MDLKIFVTSRPPRAPRGVDRDLWRVACRNAAYPYEGPTEEEPWVVQRLAKLRAELTREHHQDRPLGDAHRARDHAALAYRTAENEARHVEAETAPPIEAGGAARGRRNDPHARHLQSERARAIWRRKQTREARDRRRQDAERQALGFQTASGMVTDRLDFLAREGVAQIQHYLGLLNDRRQYLGLSALPALPADLAERLVLETGRRVGEPGPLQPPTRPT